MQKLVFETELTTYHVMTSQEGEGLLVYIQEMPVGPETGKGKKVIHLLDHSVPLLCIAANLADYTYFVSSGGELLVLRGEEKKAREVFDELSRPVLSWLKQELSRMPADTTPEA
jgi:hypothetical protein